jgi:hypothetical protein
VTAGDVLTEGEMATEAPAPIGQGGGPVHWWHGIPMAGGAYLLGSLVLWSNIWASRPTSTTNFTSNDTSAFIWFLEWPAYALTHGKSLFYSTALFHPTGINLLTNTGVLAIGVALAPITWLFGPVASLNVAMTLAPVVSALGLFVLLRRWVTWMPAAFIGGLLYGFCPFILQSLTEGQLHQGFLMFPPLIVLCLDEILFRQHVRPVVVGILLGLLVTLQFFVGTEILVMFALIAACCFVLIVVYWLRQPDRSRDRARYAVVSLLVGGGVAVALLAYPLWFALAGPAHLSGRIWLVPLLYNGNSLADFVDPVHSATSPFFGAGFTRQFLGFGLVLVCIAGLCIWRRDRKLQLAGAGAGIALILSLGANHSVALPWQLFGNLPLLENIFPDRFIIIAYLALGTMLGLIVDHTFVAVDARLDRRPPSAAPALQEGPSRESVRWKATATAIAVAAVALVPMAVYLAPSVPVTVHPVVFPSWFRHIGPDLPGRQVLLVLPMPYFLENSLTWQALDHMSYDLVSGVGPEGNPVRNGRNGAAQQFLDDLSTPGPTVPTVTPGAITMVRGAMDRWGVTTVVIPTDGKAPPYEWRVNSVPVSVAFMTLVTGKRPVLQDHAWVWHGVGTDGPPVIRSTTEFEGCVTAPESVLVSAVESADDCVLSGPSAL